MLRYRVDNGIPVMLINEAEHVERRSSPPRLSVADGQTPAPTASVATDAGAAQKPS